MYGHLTYQIGGMWKVGKRSVCPRADGGAKNCPYTKKWNKTIFHSIHKNKFYLADNQAHGNNHIKNYFLFKTKHIDCIPVSNVC